MDRRIEAAVSIIHNEVGADLPIRELAGRVNLSPSRFTHLFKAELSISPQRYVRQYRMKRAEEMLASSFLTVKEIAGTLGFSDVSHFSRDFKKEYGMTPSEFREARRRGAAE